MARASSLVALVAGIGGAVGLWLASAGAPGSGPLRSDATAAADAIASALREQRGEVHARAMTLAQIPRLTAAVGTDAATVRDLTRDELQALREKMVASTEILQQKQAEQAIRQGMAIAHAMSFTKNLANLPSNICTPTFLAEQAKELAKSHANLKVKILNEKEMHALNMGALLAVSQGSAEEAEDDSTLTRIQSRFR